MAADGFHPMQTLVSMVIRVKVWMGTCELCEAKGHMRPKSLDF